MRYTKLQRNRYARYVGERKCGLSAIAAAKRAFADYPKPPVRENARLIASTKAAIDILQKQIDELKKNAKQINLVAKIAKRYDRNAYIYTASDKVYMSVTVRGLDGFKKGVVPRMLAAFEKAAGVAFTYSSDIAANSERDFHGYSDRFTIRIDAYLKDAPKQCRKVLVKTEIRETPVYELVCS